MTLRAVPGLPSLRRASVFSAIRKAIRLGQRETFRVCEFSVQGNHVHLLVEANSRQALSRGMQGLAIRLARTINRVLGRTGKAWGDRYHARTLKTPHEVRHTLVYVLMNVKPVVHRLARRRNQPAAPASRGRWRRPAPGCSAPGGAFMD